jgi:hypothetical protein
MDQLDAIRLNAELVVQQMQPLSGLDFNYDAESIRWLDGYINRQRQEVDDATRTRLTSVLGSYLGASIINTYGGNWGQVEGEMAVVFDDNNAVFPFAKTGKQFANGPEDSIYSMFTTIPVVFGVVPQNPAEAGSAAVGTPAKPRWKFWK